MAETIKRQKNKIWEFKNEVYPRRLWIVFDNKELAKKTFVISEDESELGDDAFEHNFAVTFNVVERKDGGYKGILIHFSSDVIDAGGCKLIETIAHESFHAMNMVFREIGVEYTMYADEHSAYFVGWVANKCWEVLQKYVNNGRTNQNTTKR